LRVGPGCRVGRLGSGNLAGGKQPAFGDWHDPAQGCRLVRLADRAVVGLYRLRRGKRVGSFIGSLGARPDRLAPHGESSTRQGGTFSSQAERGRGPGRGLELGEVQTAWKADITERLSPTIRLQACRIIPGPMRRNGDGSLKDTPVSSPLEDRPVRCSPSIHG